MKVYTTLQAKAEHDFYLMNGRSIYITQFLAILLEHFWMPDP